MKIDIAKKIDGLLCEVSSPSPSIMYIRKEMEKGLSKNVHGIAFNLSQSLYHYFNPKMRGSGVIFKTKPSNSLSDELWGRMGKNIEDSEMLDDSGIKTLKSNFYRIIDKWGGLYKLSTKEKGWEWV